MTKIDTMRSIFLISYTLGITESLQPHSEPMYFSIRHDFHKPGYLISLSIVIKAKRQVGWRGSPICRNIGSRNHQRKKGHDFKAAASLKQFSMVAANPSGP